MAKLKSAEYNVRRSIARLPKLRRQKLLTLWKEVYGREAPTAIRRELLIPFLAYRIQERTIGGLKRSTRAELSRISRALDKGLDTAEASPCPRMKPGTRIIRPWKGRSIEVSVTESGFDYRGAKYRSLSQIAREITGTRWSGPAFFGLNRARQKRGSSNV